MELREYQTRTIAQLYEWLYAHPEGNPCVVLPTGAGKSVIIASFCKQAIADYPGTRILMCTHQKELIEQDFDKLMKMWPEADAGIYSAGIGRRETDNEITFCSIQSIWRKAGELGVVNIVLVDEAHLINAEAAGMYRSFIEDLRAKNRRMRVIGLTATPYRLSYGMITDKPAIFDAPLIEPVSIAELQQMGYLCELTSKCTKSKVSADGVKITAGDYNRKQLEKAVDVPGKNEDVVNEVIARSEGRLSWLFFCSGIGHAEHVAQLLRDKGVKAECVTGSTEKAERERILEDFKEGRITALTNCDVLTTGFDAPGIDLIVLMRPTQSPGLYMQMVGRGLRIAPEKKNCLVLDFAGNVERHGTIHDVKPPRKGRKGEGVAPCKTCPECYEIIAMNAKVCPVCGHEFKTEEAGEGADYQLSDMDISGANRKREMKVWRWHWSEGESKMGNHMITCRYYPAIGDRAEPVNQFFLLWHENPFIQSMAVKAIKDVARHSIPEIDIYMMNSKDLCNALNAIGKVPYAIVYEKRGKYPTYVRSIYDRPEEEV